MIAFFLSTVLAVAPTPRTIEVDIWDANTVVDERGNPGLRQVILWKWREYNGFWDYYTYDWRLADKCRGPERINGRWVGRFGKQRVSAKMFFETRTAYDFEMLDRSRLPESERR